jgi:NAD(P)-dependent dehydrogenase (short-subunit alcohol dehydrogenase family)
VSGIRYDLDGKVAIVTGASAGLGEQFAFGLAESGADVVVAARRGDELERVAAALRDRHGVRALAIPTDVAGEDDVVRLVERTVAELGSVDILVNNAGTLVAKPLVEQTLADWEHVMDVNLTSAFLTCREVAKVMTAQGSGSIVNISSIFAFGATREFQEVGYYASKGGMTMLTKALAVELAPAGVRVNAIAPGFFPTPMGAGIPQEVRDTLIAPRQLLDPLPPLEWIRGPACWLASDDARFVTGHTLVVDGGWSAL